MSFLREITRNLKDLEQKNFQGSNTIFLSCNCGISECVCFVCFCVCVALSACVCVISLVCFVQSLVNNRSPLMNKCSIQNSLQNLPTPLLHITLISIHIPILSTS